MVYEIRVPTNLSSFSNVYLVFFGQIRGILKCDLSYGARYDDLVICEFEWRINDACLLAGVLFVCHIFSLSCSYSRQAQQVNKTFRNAPTALWESIC
jgi:hypothetical protein